MASYSSKTTKAAGGVYIDADKEQSLKTDIKPRAIRDIITA